jgi:hypothetical protein
MQPALNQPELDGLPRSQRLESHNLFFQLLVPITIGKQPNFVRQGSDTVFDLVAHVGTKFSCVPKAHPPARGFGAMQAPRTLNV